MTTNGPRIGMRMNAGLSMEQRMIVGPSLRFEAKGQPIALNNLRKKLSLTCPEMGLYLDIHVGETTEGQITPQQVRDLLLRDGAKEEEDGTIYFAGGMGLVASTGRKQKGEQKATAANQVLLAASLPLPRAEEAVTDGELVSFRYSCGSSPGSMRNHIRDLLDFCQRRGLRLYDWRAKRYITTGTADIVVESPAHGKTTAERSLGAPDDGGPQSRSSSIRLVASPTNVSEMLVTDLDLSVRSRLALRHLSIRTLGELANRTESDLLSWKNIGTRSIDEIKEKLAEFNLTLRSAESTGHEST